jgi:DNA-binding beta-propeller fold protein YncE
MKSRWARARRGLALAASAAVVATVAGVSGAGPASAAITPPTFVQTIGHPGHAGVYAWGMATAKDGSILVGDYWNYQVRRYTTTGQLLQTFSQKGTDPGENMAPHGLAVDPRDGSIYMADMNAPWKIQKFDANGSFLYSISTYVYGVTTPYPYVTRVQVLSDGTLLALSSHNIPSLDGFAHRVLEFNGDTGAYIGAWGVNGSAPGQFGLQRGFAVGPNDEVYVGDATKQLIQVFDRDGHYLRSMGQGRFNGDMRGIAIDDDNGWVYVVDAAASQIEKFTLSGTWLAAWGSEGTGPGQFRDGGRELTVGQDHRIYAADFGNNRVNVYNPDGTNVRYFPNPAPQPEEGGFNEPQDVSVNYAGTMVYVADTYNHRVEVFDRDGNPTDQWGFRGSTDPYALNYPRGIAVRSNGEVWVMNSRQGNAKVYSKTGTFLRELLSWGEDPGQTNLARGISVDKNGKVYVADSSNRRLQVLDQQGHVLVNVPCGGPPPPPPSMALLEGCTGVDTDSAGNIYAAAPTEHTVYKFSPTGALLMKIGTGPGSGNGQLRAPYDVAVRNGRLYVTETNNARVSVFSTRGVYQGKFGTRGDEDGQFQQPKGIDIDGSGRVYIVDSQLERVEVFQLHD